jgi:hypothetical protein
MAAVMAAADMDDDADGGIGGRRGGDEKRGGEKRCEQGLHGFSLFGFGVRQTEGSESGRRRTMRTLYAQTRARGISRRAALRSAGRGAWCG